MRFREWIKNIFYTEKEVSSGNRRLKLKPTLISLSAFMIIFLICKSIFGQSKVKPDEDNYSSVGADTVARQGTVIIKIGDVEIRKNSKNNDHISVYSGGGFSGADQGQVISRKDRNRGEYVLPAGTKVSVTLEGALNSQLSQSPVVASILETFTFKGKKLIPVGSKVLGRVTESSDSERLGVIFDQLVYPSGVQISAQSSAMMEDGSPGIVGDFHSGRWTQFAGSIGLSFISGAAAALESSQANAFGYNQPVPSSQNAILNGLAKATLDQGKRM